MNLLKINNLNFLFPLSVFNNEYFFFKNKLCVIKYIYQQVYYVSFIKSIKIISNNYLISKKLLQNIKKSNVITRNAIAKSTKKPWRQKGLGKARAGSSKSPLWRGGSVLFGPISRKLSIILQTKKKKISIFYLLLNKRTYISFIFLTPNIHTYNNIIEYLEQQKRIKGYFSNKLIYILYHKINIKFSNNTYFNYINSLNIFHWLKFDYIIFLI